MNPRAILILSILASKVYFSRCFWRQSIELPKIASTGSNNGQQGSSSKRESDELGMVLNQWNALKTHSQRSDCFKDASLALYTSCESLDFDSDARVKVAVHMAMCELTTADHASLPLECKSLRPDASSKSVSQCVEALARSAQHWSSYSGYLREIPQLCSAYRRLHEIDHAKSIYANITNEKITFLSSLGGHYSELASRQQELSELTQGLGSILSALEQHSLILDHSLSKFPRKADELATDIHVQVSALLEAVFLDTQRMNQHTFTKLDHQFAAAISEARDALSLTTKNVRGDVSSILGSLEAVALSWNSRLVAFNRRLDVMWDETFDQKLALEHALDDMRARVAEAGAQVGLQLAAAERLQELSAEASASIEHANTQLVSTSTTLSQELSTLISVTQELQSNMTQLPNLVLRSRWIPDILGSLSSVVNGFRIPGWQAQLVMQVVGAGASGLQTSLSLLLTFACALLFVTSHTFRSLSHLAKSLLRWCSNNSKPIHVKSSARPQMLVKRRVYRRPQPNHSRLSSVLPHREPISL